MLPEASQGLKAVSYGRYKDVSEAVELIDELLEVGFRRVDCLHQLILANLKLGNYTKAKETLEIGSQRSSEAQEAADVWLHLEPDNGALAETRSGKGFDPRCCPDASLCGARKSLS